MRNKVLGVVLAAVLVAGTALMAGCGGGNAAPASSKAAAAPAASSAAAPAAPAAQSSAAQATTIEVPVTFTNSLPIDLAELYLSGAGRDDWGNNLLPSGIKAGQSAKGALVIDQDNVQWDVKAIDNNGDAVEFQGLDLSNCSTSGVTLTLAFDGEDFVVTAE